GVSDAAGAAAERAGGPRAREGRGIARRTVAGVRGSRVRDPLLPQRERDVSRRGGIVADVVAGLLELALERAPLPPPHPHEAEAAAGGTGGADDAGVGAVPVFGEALDEPGVGGGADVVGGVGAGAVGVAEG